MEMHIPLVCPNCKKEFVRFVRNPLKVRDGDEFYSDNECPFCHVPIEVTLIVKIKKKVKK